MSLLIILLLLVTLGFLARDTAWEVAAFKARYQAARADRDPKP